MTEKRERKAEMPLPIPRMSVPGVREAFREMEREEEREVKNPTMGFNDMACALRDFFVPFSAKMGAQGNTLWITSIAEKIGAIRLIEKGKGMFSGTYELVAGSIDDVAWKVIEYYQAQFD